MNTIKQQKYLGVVVRTRDLPQLTGLSRTTIHRLRVANDFVPAIHLTKHSIGFRLSDIEEWLEARTENIGQKNEMEVTKHG